MEFDSDDISESDEDRPPTWDEVMFHEETDIDISLDAEDYLALTIAALQTVFLPLVILMIFLFIIGLYFGLIF